MLSLRYKSLSKNYFKLFVFLVLSITKDHPVVIFLQQETLPLMRITEKELLEPLLMTNGFETKAIVNLKN